MHLPAGRWVDLYSGEVLDGGRTIVRDTPLDEIPLYMKAGATIPFNLRSPDAWADGWKTDALSQPGRAGWMVAPARGPVAVRLRGAPAQAQVLVLASRAPREVRVDGHRRAWTPARCAPPARAGRSRPRRSAGCSPSSRRATAARG